MRLPDRLYSIAYSVKSDSDAGSGVGLETTNVSKECSVCECNGCAICFRQPAANMSQYEVTESADGPLVRL